MTQWVEDPMRGLDAGPAAVVRAWVEVLVRPRTFFRDRVAPGDQASAFGFVVGVATVAATSHFALVPTARPVMGGRPVASVALAVGFLALVVAPLGLHLVAALQTAVLVALVPDRAGVSETVQVLAYATAPCVLAGVPAPGLGVACSAYGAALLAVGLGEVHDVSLPAAAVLGAPAAALVFGYGFRGFAALGALAAA